jgi:hypothetical protein
MGREETKGVEAGHEEIAEEDGGQPPQGDGAEDTILAAYSIKTGDIPQAKEK